MLLTGGTIITLGFVLLIGQLHVHGPATPLAWVTTAAAVMSAGNGLVLPALIGAALTDVHPDRAGVGAGMLTPAQQFAAATGVALIGGVYFTLASAHPGPSASTTAATGTASIDLTVAVAVAVAVAVQRTKSTSTLER